MNARTARPCLLLFIALACGCFGSERVPGEFELVGLNSAPLPQALGDNRCQGSLVAGSLALRRDSTWRGQLVVHDPCSAITDTSHYAGGWRLHNKQLVMSIDSFSYQPTPRRRAMPAVHDSVAGTVGPAGIVLTYAGFRIRGRPMALGLRRVR